MDEVLDKNIEFYDNLFTVLFNELKTRLLPLNLFFLEILE